LGSARVTHPFHQLSGQTFEVLKIRRLASGDSLSLRHPELGSFALRRDWTDWGAPAASPEEGGAPLLIDVLGLIELAELVASIKPTRRRA
jgi:hypothetical protein